jgi:hypothetical protein
MYNKNKLIYLIILLITLIIFITIYGLIKNNISNNISSLTNNISCLSNTINYNINYTINYNTTFNNNRGIIYIENIFKDSIFNTIQKSCNKLNNTLKRDNLINGERYGTHITNGFIKKLIDSNEFTNFINKIVVNRNNLSIITKNNIKLSNFPIEYRIYPEKSDGMEWHKDTLLYNIPQYECVFTIENNSDSNTLWKDENNHINTIKTQPNSLIIVLAEGPHHRVTPINSGYRSILKFIFSNGTPIDSIVEHDIKCRYNKCINDNH